MDEETNVRKIIDEIGENFSWQELLNKTNANVYITDIETDRIIFMSEHMKQEFGLTDVEGEHCWKILQQGMSGRCSFCKIRELLKNGEKDAICIWDEESTLNGQIYRNMDMLLYMQSGKIFHMQHSMDVTEYRKLYHSAQTDELTGMLNRRSGKNCLKQMMEEAKAEAVTLTIVMYDVNELKRVNDLYGHKEGDHMLRYISDIVRDNLTMQDEVFRLGGDEFVIIFYDFGMEKAERHLRHILETLDMKRGENQIFYPISFSYGMLEVKPEDHYSLSDILIRIDEKMYEQKRAFHIQKAQKSLEAQEVSAGRAIQLCKYENDEFYELLEKSTSNYIFIGYLKNGTFQYPKTMVEEFDLPGQIVPNAAAVWGRLIHPEDKMHFLESNQEIADGRIESHQIKYRAQNRRGQWVWLQCTGNMKRDQYGEPELFVGVITNLGEREKMDSITKLPNKFEFEAQMRSWMEHGSEEQPFTVMLLNLDDFKNINECYDRDFGDEVLYGVARQISMLLPEYAELFRLDGDSFGILLEAEDGADERLFQRLQENFRSEQEWNRKRFRLSFSAGTADYPEDGKNAKKLLKNASYALEYSKMRGKNRMTKFSTQILKQRKQNMELVDTLKECISRDFEGFSVFYQPLVNAKNGEVCGAEALLRWYDEEKGMIAPMEIIPVLEQSGLIVQVGRWFLKRVIADCKDWNALKPGYLMSVNVSYLQFINDNLPQAIAQILEEYEVPASNLSLELTETSFIRETQMILDDLEELRAMGVGITMDDFGSGDSSLENLKKIPVDMVKIDRVFVSGITKNAFDQTLVRFMVELCHNVNRKVCLEGVESQEEYEAVKAFDLDYIQGYYFGRPMKKEIFESLLL